jgi:protein-S-isoprenylcysteine O-methyltransferase Ste14
VTRLPDLGPRGEGWVVLQGILLVAVLAAGLLAGDAWAGTPALVTSLAGAALLIAGAALLVRGSLDLGRGLTPMPRPRADAQLVQSGVYALVRHPLYGGVILGSFGYGLLMASPLTLLLACLVAAFFVLKSRREEGWLLEHFAGYAGYVERTRRFIPWLY